MARRSHRKSRRGCANCRERKIKCDERMTGCSQCEKHNVQCAYLSLQPENAAMPDLQRPLPVAQRQHAALPGVEARKFSDREGMNNLDLESFELFYHFLFEVCDKTFRSPRTNLVWKKEVLRLACQHEFLMHGILALSAFCVARNDVYRSRVFNAKALEHQSLALGLYWPAMDRIDVSNGEALFAFAHLLAPMGFCSPAGRECTLGKATHCLQMCRGFRLVREKTLSIVAAGRLSPLLEFPEPSNNCIMEELSEKDEYLEYRGLKIKNPNCFLDVLITRRDDLWSLSESDIGTYKVIIDSLRGCFFHVKIEENLDYPPPQVPTWAASLPEVFMHHLSQDKPLPLVILAFFCIAFVTTEQRWFSQGWAQSTLSEIQQLFPDSRQRWIEWPVHTMELIMKR